MTQQANNGKPIAKGNVSGGNALPDSSSYPQPKAPGSIPGGSAIYPESAAALKALGLSQPIAKNRPKGL